MDKTQSGAWTLSEKNVEQLQEGYDLFTKQLRYNRRRKAAFIISNVVFYIMSILIVLGLYGRVGNAEDMAILEQVPFLCKLARGFAMPNLDWREFIILGLVLVAVIPFVVFLSVLLISAAINRGHSVPSLTGDGKADTQTVCAAGKKASNRYSESFLPKCILLGGVAGILFCVGAIAEGVELSQGNGLVSVIAAILICAVIVPCAGVIWLIMGLPLWLMRLPFATSSKKCKQYDSLVSTLEKNWDTVEKAREKAQKEAQEKAEAARKEEERRRKEEERQQKAQEAEDAFRELANPSEQQDEVKRLAKAGSPSACAIAGQNVYLDYCNNPHTRVEKEALVKEAKGYLQIAADAGNVESQFLLLSLRVMADAHVYSEWDALLKEARAIQKSGKLPEHYSEPMTDLQQAIVDVMDRTPVNTAQKEAPKDEKPRIKRTYCKFCASGTCTFYSTASYLAKCNHLNDPGNCSAALNERALGFEFY